MNGVIAWQKKQAQKKQAQKKQHGMPTLLHAIIVEIGGMGMRSVIAGGI